MARIIVIDDQEAVRTVVRRALESAGHVVLEAGDGETGLELLAVGGADLVITDMFMPGQDGIGVLRRIRKDFPTVRVIVISGGDPKGRFDMPREVVELLGASRNLAKPFAPADLVKAVREVLDRG